MNDSRPAPLVDRLVAATGGRALVAETRGLGWLAVEVIPAFIWTQITGALSMEFFYFVSFLSALGVAKSRMPALTMAVMAAGIGVGFLVLRRPAADPRRQCIIDTLIGRCLWVGTVLGPLAAYSLGLSSLWILAIALVFVFAAQLTHMAGVSSFITWTQQVIPASQRGIFYGWRYISSYIVVAIVLFGIGRILPGDALHGAGIIPLAILLLGATLIGIAGIWPLAQAPTIPLQEQVIAHAPLLPQVYKNKPFLRFVAWSLVTNIALAVSPAMQPDLYHRAGVGEATMATWQAVAYYPAMLIGIIWTGRALPRTGARQQLLIAHTAMMLGESALLLLNAERLGWLMPLVLCCLGIARGMWSIAWVSRLQEIIPRGDARFAALAISAGATIGLLGSITALFLSPGLERWLDGHLGWPSLAWVLVATGVLARLLATPFLLRHDED